MREAALVLVAVAVCSASVLEFVTLPKTISIKSANRELRLSEVPLLNENLLGLTAKPVSGRSLPPLPSNSERKYPVMNARNSEHWAV
ncbi:hypothetical protein COOONC_12322 [Cooperia oncophora]